MTIILFDTPQTHTAFYPLTLTKPVAYLRRGILTIQEWWQRNTGWKVLALGDEYLGLDAIPANGNSKENSESGSLKHEPGQEVQEDSFLYIDASFLPEKTDGLTALPIGKVLTYKGRLIAVKTTVALSYPVSVNNLSGFESEELIEADFLQAPWQLFQTNTQAIEADYKLLTLGRVSQPVDPTNIITGGSDIFLEEGVVMKGCFLNASEGPIYIGKDALIMEASAIRGPIAICNNAVVKMGAKIYGGTTVGPYCTAGGEIKNAILSAYSNKAHDGYLGDAVIGEWCNLGAGTTNSNVKNTAGVVKMWSEAAGELVLVGKKAGLIMGDYSRSAINTGFNTGTVVGACSNVFGNGQPPKHVPSFTWGNERYQFDKALSDIANWKAFKGQQLEEKEKKMLMHLYQQQVPKTEM